MTHGPVTPATVATGDASPLRPLDRRVAQHVPGAETDNEEQRMSNPRVRKVADRIQVIVAEMLERRIKDPRLGFVTVTDVRVTGDTQHASVFYTVLGEDEQRRRARRPRWSPPRA